MVKAMPSDMLPICEIVKKKTVKHEGSMIMPHKLSKEKK